MHYPKRSQYRHCKKAYRVTNWPEYDRSLRNRGDLTIWFDESSIGNWHSVGKRKPGGKVLYSRMAIEAALTIHMVYQLPLRQTEGFLRSLSRLLDLRISIPDHTTISRRSKKLKRLPIQIPRKNSAINLVIDSTGLQIHVGSFRKPPKRRDYRKLHVGVDRETGAIVSCELSSKSCSDAGMVPKLLNHIDGKIKSVTADGAYESRKLYNQIIGFGVPDTKVLAPPPRSAKISKSTTRYSVIRNRRIKAIEKHGRMEWERKSGYTKRNIVENTIGRYKMILGNQMRSRSLAGQRAEVRIGCRIINKMTELGMPMSSKIE